MNAALRSAMRALVAGGAMLMAETAVATTYKCETDGRTVYGDRPCTTGRQTEVATETQGPSAADRAAAAARQRKDEATLAAMQKQRLDRERVAPVSPRAEAERRKHAATCAKLALKAKRAKEDADGSTLVDLSKRQSRNRRAQDDYAATCGTRG